MIGSLNAIQTRYKNYKFRSRLEARWVVFFDALGLEWEYEKEGFDLDDAGYYLPDFWFPQISYFGEVKPFEFTPRETKKAEALVIRSMCHLVKLIGVPEVKGYPVLEAKVECIPGSNIMTSQDIWYANGIWYADDICRDIDDFQVVFSLDDWGEYKMLSYCFTDGSADDAYHEDTARAVKKAKEARFEFGETPK